MRRLLCFQDALGIAAPAKQSTANERKLKAAASAEDERIAKCEKPDPRSACRQAERGKRPDYGDKIKTAENGVCFYL